MSHIAEIDLVLSDLTALSKAAEACGMELVRDASQFTYYAGMQAQCIHKLRFKDAPQGAYEIGLRYADISQKSYKPWFDSFGAHGQRLERTFPKLRQRYASEVTAAQLRKQGYRVTMREQADGSLRVQGTK